MTNIILIYQITDCLSIHCIEAKSVYNLNMINVDGIYSLLSAWALQSEKYWFDIPGAPGLGCYGSGYNAWGVQTNQKYFSALAALAVHENQPGLVSAQWAKERALSSLRFSLSSHCSGSGTCTDGSQWGHTWISALGIERMMQGVYRIEPYLTDRDTDAIRRMLASEADWLLLDYRKGQVVGLAADLWDKTGRNQPESNIWNGALLWRAAVTMPEHPHAVDWQEKAHQFLINGVSVSLDAIDDNLVAGKSVRSRHVGANFFEGYALDHHGYLNIGYMAICASNAAMLHFDLKMKRFPRPETLDHHQADLWQLIRRLIFQNGRLVRIGGDTRVRYAYCQDYLLPALLYAADHLGDPFALTLAEQQVDFVRQEADWNLDGSFYSRRLAELGQASEYYYTRLESDRACALAQVCAYLPVLFTDSQGKSEPVSAQADNERQIQQFELSVDGSWIDQGHGAVLHRSPTRLASFAWRSQGLAQGLCLPPTDGHLSDWEGNLSAQIEFVHHPHPLHPSAARQRELIDFKINQFDGGFVTSGSLEAGADIELAEGWRGHDMAVQYLAFAALPDDRTVLAIEFCKMKDKRGLIRFVKGMHFNLANDLYNGFSRDLQTEKGQLKLISPAAREEIVALPGKSVCIDQKLGLVAVSGAESLKILRSTLRDAGAYHSLYIDEICCELKIGPFWAGPNEIILDSSWAVLSSADFSQTQQASASAYSVPSDTPGIRMAAIIGADQKQYLLAANFSSEIHLFSLPPGEHSSVWMDLTTNIIASKIELLPGRARLLCVSNIVTNL